MDQTLEDYSPWSGIEWEVRDYLILQLMARPPENAMGSHGISRRKVVIPLREIRSGKHSLDRNPDSFRRLKSSRHRTYWL